jgi:alkaline phosphatase D
MSQRKPEHPGHSRRAVLRALGLGLPAVAACNKPYMTTNPPGPYTSTLPTGSTGETGVVGTTDTATTPPTEDRTPEPTEPWQGMGPDDRTAFPMGVQTGDPTDTSLVVWTFCPGATQLTLHVALFDGTTWQAVQPITVGVGPDGYVHHTLGALPADQPLAVQFVDAKGAASAIGSARTAPSPDALVEVYLGATSCLDQSHGEFPSLDEVRTLGRLDAMLWLGDTVYADGNVALEDYRALWQEQLSKSTFQRCFAEVPGIWSWDDHEVGNNWDPQSIDPTQLDNAVTAFHETVPLPDEVRTTRTLWRSLRFGATVELFVLDCRGERHFDEGHYVSPQQLQWLMESLSASDAVWKVVATSVPITDMPPLWDVAEAHLDRWDGFPGTQRADLLAHIRDSQLSGVFFVAGDLHQTTVSRVDPPGGAGEGLLEVMAGPGGSFRNAIARTLDDEQWLYADADWSATRLTFRPDGTARIQVAYEEGGELMLDMTIDTAGEVVRIDTVRNPWRESTTTP